jgi:rRNA maturation protein Rpf1
VAEKALEFEADRVIIIDRWKGGPGKIEFFKVDEGLIGAPPLLYIRGIKLQREIGFPKTRSFRSLAVTASYASNETEIPKIAKALSNFLNAPLVTLDEVFVEKYEAFMHVSRDVSGRIRITFFKLPENCEIGPRITLSHTVWSLEKPSYES